MCPCISETRYIERWEQQEERRNFRGRNSRSKVITIQESESARIIANFDIKNNNNNRDA